MANGNGFNTGSIMEFLIDYGISSAAAFIADAGVEYTKFPYLDEVPGGGFDQGPAVSNYESMIHLVGGALAIFGGLDIVTKKKLFGIGRWAVPTGLGLLFGTSFYESYGAEALGIRPKAPAA